MANNSSITITADGKCVAPPEQLQEADTIELVIDGNMMLGGVDSPTLLGLTKEYLPASVQYRLDHFEPRSDGSCLLRYTRVES